MRSVTPLKTYTQSSFSGRAYQNWLLRLGLDAVIRLVPVVAIRLVRQRVRSLNARQITTADLHFVHFSSFLIGLYIGFEIG